jgi:hypothetical protein
VSWAWQPGLLPLALKYDHHTPAQSAKAAAPVAAAAGAVRAATRSPLNWAFGPGRNPPRASQGKNPHNVTGYTLRIPLRSERGSPHPNPSPPTRASKAVVKTRLHFEGH